jgi:hypothetical protein
MWRLPLTLGLTVLALAAATGPAHAGGPGLTLGVAEDTVKQPDPVVAQVKMRLLRLAGFSAVRITSQWLPGDLAPPNDQLEMLRVVTGAAKLAGVRVYVSVYQPGSRTTPLTPEARAEFAQYAATLVTAVPLADDVIVGNEPNLNRFWLPQFNPDGSNAAAPAYLQLLAQTYDAIKAADPGVTVWGGALAPRGNDNPKGTRHTHSPTKFIRDLGIAYRAGGRTAPVMDGFTFHPYPDNSSQSPDTRHPNISTIGLADYDKLVRLLGVAFDGTAQAGSTLPILYDEFGIESIVPKGKLKHYTGTEPTTTKPVSEALQATYYQRGLRLAFCQPNVVGMLLFHSQDEHARLSWQSGVYYADGTPKSSLRAVRDALERTRGGSVARCPGLGLDVQPTALRFPTQDDFAKGERDVRLRCDLDCAWELRATRSATGGTAAVRRGYARAGTAVVASLRGARLGSGAYRLQLTLVHPVNPGVPALRESAELQLPPAG